MENKTPVVDAIVFTVEGDWLLISMYVKGNCLGKSRIPFRFFVEAFSGWLEDVYGEE